MSTMLLILALAGSALAQPSDPAAAVAATRDSEVGMAAEARAVSKSAIDKVFGAGTGASDAAAAGAAPPPGDANAWAAEDAQAGAAPAIEAAEAPIDPTDPADGRRDPFRPFTLDLRGAVQEVEILSPLQRFEIAQLKLTGLVLDMAPPRAMLQDNSGMGFIITPGTPIGRRHGVVKSIEPGRVVVEEMVLDYYGRQQTHQVVMEMPRDDQGDEKKKKGQEKP
jgi:Tfp pilus assembly protein PilP